MSQVDAGVDDEAGVPGPGKLLFHKESDIHVVRIPDVGDEDTDHFAGAVHQSPGGLVWRVAVFLQQFRQLAPVGTVQQL